MNDVTVIGGQRFCDDSTKYLSNKMRAMEGGGQSCPKLRDFIYGRPYNKNEPVLENM